MITFEYQERDFPPEAALYEFATGLLPLNIEKYRENRITNKVSSSPFGELKKLDQSSMLEVISDWEKVERRGLREYRMWRVFDWFSGISALIFLILSVIWFGQWQKGCRAGKWLFIAAAGQAFILWVVIEMVLVSWTMPVILFVAPLILGIWFFQVVSCLARLRNNVIAGRDKR